jgi:hypothetical protein
VSDGAVTLDAVAAERAPMDHAHAAALLVPVVRELLRADSAGRDLDGLPATEVVLGEDGTVQLTASSDHGRDDASGAEELPVGVLVGRWYFRLLVGRAPLGRDDAFEPVVTSGATTSVRSLVAGACSDQPGQWPGLVEWQDALVEQAGRLAPPPSPAERRAAQRRRWLVAAGLALLIVVSLLVLWLAPRWWNDATEDAVGPPLGVPSAQELRDSSNTRCTPTRSCSVTSATLPRGTLPVAGTSG